MGAIENFDPYEFDDAPPPFDYHGDNTAPTTSALGVVAATPTPVIMDGQPTDATLPDLRLPAGMQFMGGDDWDEEIELQVTEFLAVEGGPPLLYENQSHCIFGKSGSGKTWMALLAIFERARAGDVSLLLDYESDINTIKGRLKSLGMTKAEAGRVAYWNLAGGLDPKAIDYLVSFITEYKVRLVCLDSVAQSMSALSLKENENDDFNLWNTRVVVPLVKAPTCVLLIDHTGHDGQNGKAAHARGASSKRAVLTGVSYMFEATKSWSRERGGFAQLTTDKDRLGCRASGTIACKIEVLVEDGGNAIAFRLHAGQDSNVTTADGQEVKRPSTVMEWVSDYLSDNAGKKITKTDIRDWVSKHGGSKGTRTQNVTSAIKFLEDEGYILCAKRGGPVELIHEYDARQDRNSDRYDGDAPI